MKKEEDIIPDMISVSHPTYAWHGDAYMQLSFPDSWDVVLREMKGHDATALDEAGIKPYTPREKLGSITLLDTSESFMEISNKRSDSQLYRRFFDPRNGSLVKDLRKKK